MIKLFFFSWWLSLWNVSRPGDMNLPVNTSPYILVSCGFMAKRFTLSPAQISLAIFPHSADLGAVSSVLCAAVSPFSYNSICKLELFPDCFLTKLVCMEYPARLLLHLQGSVHENQFSPRARPCGCYEGRRLFLSSLSGNTQGISHSASRS